MRFPAWSFALSLLSTTLVAVPAGALVWPDVIEEVQSGLNAPAAQTRRAAAERIASLGASVALPLLQKALSDSDVDVRLAAAQSATRLRSAEATEIVLPWFRERDVRLRVAACEVARALPSPKAVPELARALADTESPLVRAAAAEALGASMHADAAPPLLGRLDDPSPTVRVQVIRALAKLRDARAVVPLVGKAQDSAPEVRQAVARALGDLADPRAAQTLIQLLRDPVLDVKLEALGALGRMRAEASVATLAPLASDRTSAVRNAAITAIGRIGNKESIRVLIGLLGQSEDATMTLDRTPVRDALVAAGEVAIPDLVATLDGASSGARAASAAWILGELGATAEAPRVIAALRRGSLPAAAALRALAGCGSAASVPVVLEYLADPSPAARSEAMRAASALLDPAKPDGRAVEPLVAALRTRGLTDAERASLARLLGRTGAARAAAPLVALLGAREPALRLAAVDALGQLGPAGADDALLRLLREPEADVRLRSAIALSKAGGEKARDTLLAWIDGGDGVDRAAVLTALAGVLTRVPTPGAITRVRQSLELSAGGDRDALILILGRSPLGTAALAELATDGDDDDRRAIASVIGAVPDSQRASTLKVLLADRDPSVRAQAVWASTYFADTPSEASKLATSSDADVACNAVAAVVRAPRAAGRPSSGGLGSVICSALGDPRPLVRANALHGVAKGERCDLGRVRTLLASDSSLEVRAAAAHALWSVARQDSRNGSASEAKAALLECSVSDRSPRVARVCAEKPAEKPGQRPGNETERSNPVEIFVVPYGATIAKPRTPYVLELADGVVRCGVTDRRGALFEPKAPEGPVTIRRP